MGIIKSYVIIGIVVSIIIIINLIIGQKQRSQEKIQPYECGIVPIGSNRNKINIEYIIIGILYIIFDIEIILIIPYSMTQNKKYTYWIVMIVIIILTLGFIFELNKGALKSKGRLT